MFSLPFFKKPKESNKFICLEINADSIKAAAFYYEDQKAKIIGYGEETLPEDVVRCGNIIDKEKVTDSARNAILKAIEEMEDGIEDVIIGVGDDVCLGITTTVRAKRGGHAPISQTELNQIYQRLNNASNMQAQDMFIQSTGDANLELESVTSSNVYSRINGKEVDDPLGKGGQLLESAIFNAFVPVPHVKNIKDLVKSLKLNLYAMGPKLYTLTQAIRTTENQMEKTDFVILEIGTDTTNVGVVFGGGLVATKALNIGFRHFVQGISNKMGLTLKESERVFTTYCAGKLAEEETGVIQKCINTILNIWIEGLETLFSEFADVKTFAPKVYITGKGAIIPDVVSALKERPWAKSIPFKDDPEIQKIELNDLTTITDFTGKISSTAWVPCASLAVIYLEMKEDDQDRS